MRRSDTYLALAFAAALIVPMPAVAEDHQDLNVLHVEFNDAMPAFIQTSGSGGRDVEETSIRRYAYRITRGESVKPPVGFAVRPAPTGCDKPSDPCPDRRAALPDDRANDLPANFNIEISDDLQGERVRRDMRSVEIYQDGPSQWVTLPAGQTPYQPYGGGTVQVLATYAGKLRPGALAQADCFPAVRLCTVRISYSRDLRVNFLSQATDEGMARQVRAVDAVMRSVIRNGPFPVSGPVRVAKQGSPSTEQSVWFPGMPQDRIRAALAKP